MLKGRDDIMHSASRHVLIEQVMTLRGKLGTLYDFKDLPVPFFYVHRPGPRGGVSVSLAFPTVDWFSAARLCGRAGRLTAKNGGFRPGRAVLFFISCIYLPMFAYKLALRVAGHRAIQTQFSIL